MEMIGRAAITAMAQVTDSPKPSRSLPATRPAMAPPATISECCALKAWADGEPDGHEPASIEELAKHLQFLNSTLPRQAADADAGKKRTAVYARILGSFSSDALAFMTRRACETLDWFPTPHQCLEILKEYQEPATDKQIALSLCQSFWQTRMDEFLTSLRDGVACQADVEGAPHQWRMVAMERGYLRLMDDGAFVIRSKGLAATGEQR